MVGDREVVRDAAAEAPTEDRREENVEGFFIGLVVRGASDRREDLADVVADDGGARDCRLPGA